MTLGLSLKELKIHKARSKELLIIVAATFVAVFSLISAKALISQAAYQRQVLQAKRLAANQLKENVSNAQSLAGYYNEVFLSNDPQNIIGGRNTSDAKASPPDGNNARVVLNALPVTYDFPALITSVNKILSNNGIVSPTISAADQSDTIDDSPSANPQPVPIRLVVSGTANHRAAQNLIRDFERSIRPFNIVSVQLQGSGSAVNLTLAMDTYFQPAKVFKLETRELR